MSDPAATRPAGPARPWPVVLVHGTRTSHSQWDPQVPALRAAGHHVLAPDLPGHGARRGESFTLEAAQSVIEGAARTAHEATALPVHLVGSSLGGMLAIRSAARLGAADRADAGTDWAGASPVLGSLVACGAAVQPTPLTARLYARLITATDLLPAMRSGSEAFPFTWLLGRDGARAYLRGGRADIDVVAPAFAAVASLDLRGELSRIPVPVTFLHGRFEQLRLHERSFAAAAPQGRLELLPYGNHMLNLVRAERFTPDLLRVLARAERPTSPGTTQDRLGP
ncbi:alpha/beta fold hydrolase [Brachybacterium paraconglomeratum]|uniref:alpha/beta fold hydrolase n=1 Tax=Brachybacterium paraconglomeratum TaxID=173362 RepID=UPI0037C7EC8F